MDLNWETDIQHIEQITGLDLALQLLKTFEVLCRLEKTVFDIQGRDGRELRGSLDVLYCGIC